MNNSLLKNWSSTIGWCTFLVLIIFSSCEKTERIYYDSEDPNVVIEDPTAPVNPPTPTTYTETQDITEHINMATTLSDIHEDPQMVDYRVTLKSWEINHNLIVEGGVVIEFVKDAEVIVSTNCVLQTYSYDFKEIRFTCKEKTAGGWIGIVGQPRSNISISNTTIEYAGGKTSSSDLGAASIKTEGNLGFTYSKISNSAGFGLRTFNNGSFSYIYENRFTDIEKAAIITSVDHLHTIDMQLEFARNGHDGVQITSSVFEDGPCPEPWETLTKSGVGSYLIQNEDPAIPAEVLVETNLQIFPGVTVHFGEGSSLLIKANLGMMTALGTAEYPITFAGKSAQKGSWKGIFFEQSLETSYMDYVTIEHAGSDVFDADLLPYKGNIGVHNAALKISNSTISNSEGCAFATSDPQTSVIIEANNTFTNNDGGQFCGL